MFTMRSLLAISTSLLFCVPSLAQSVTAASATSTSSSATSTPSVWRVNVGNPSSNAGLTFEPNTTYAALGDIVEFVFFPSNHSVIRAEYTGSDACGPSGCNPCVPYDLIHGSGGFHSGNVITQDISQIVTGSRSWNYTVNITGPIFFYCNALGSCHPSGMIGVINPTELTSLSKQKEAAIAAPFQLAPGQAWPMEGTQVGAEPSSASITPNSTAPSTPAASSHHSLSGGAIAGIVIGALAVLCLAAALFYFMGRSKTYKDMFKSSRSNDGGMSQVGDNVGPWSPGSHGGAGAPVNPYRDNPTGQQSGGYQDHRISHMTYNSQMTAPSDGGTFIGYNRNTGAPEFAAEAAAEQPGPQYSRHSSPLVPQAKFTPPTQHQVYEVPGDQPSRSEKP